MLPAKSIPITIVAGFLGAGKTSLINHFLLKDYSQYPAVLVNDFGAVKLDVGLTAPIGNIQLMQGCICCSSRAELLASIGQMSSAELLPGHILIEASGVADPAAIVNALKIQELIARAFVQSVITIVAADQILGLKGEMAQMAKMQISAANLVALNKVDLVSTRQLDCAFGWLQSVNADLPVITTKFGYLPKGAFTKVVPG